MNFMYILKIYNFISFQNILYKFLLINSFLLINLNNRFFQQLAKFNASIVLPAKIILPAKGDSTWAFNNQVFKNIVGVFTANDKKIP